MKTLTLCAALAAALGLAAPAAQAEDSQLRTLRVCDRSACYIAWNVVDSDGDGYNDADEIVAGTDPYDAGSHPDLPQLRDLIGAQQLPTFEFGVGKMVIKPAELHTMLEEYGGGESPLTAFPLGERKDAMTRLGLDTELLAEHGYDAEFDGLTLVRGHDDNDAPVRRVGGVDIRLISTETTDDGEAQINDVVDFINHDDGATTLILDNGDSIHMTVDGHGTRMDKNGKILDDWYVNPDADTSGNGEVTDEQKRAWERIRNATVLTVAGWSGVEPDPETLRDPNETIILIDPEHQELEGEVFEPPQIRTAQPDYRPDLPNPLRDGGGCFPKCGT